jgi:hypothetical protein
MTTEAQHLVAVANQGPFRSMKAYVRSLVAVTRVGVDVGVSCALVWLHLWMHPDIASPSIWI